MKRIYETAGYISDNLTHWTGNGLEEIQAYNILSIIIRNQELKFGKPENNLIYDKNDIKIGQAMICFTDTPLEQSHVHRRKYGSFGISFKKETLIPYGAHPVFYYLDEFSESVLFIQDLIHEYNIKNKIDFRKNWLNNFFQPYNTKKDKGFPEYFEREWRITRILPYLYKPNYEKQFGKIIEYEFKGSVRRDENKDDFYLRYEKTDIDSIIVLEDYENRMIDLLDDLSIKCDLISLIKRK